MSLLVAAFGPIVSALLLAGLAAVIILLAALTARVGQHRSEVRMWRHCARVAGEDRDRWMRACADAWAELDGRRPR